MNIKQKLKVISIHLLMAIWHPAAISTAVFSRIIFDVLFDGNIALLFKFHDSAAAKISAAVFSISRIFSGELRVHMLSARCKPQSASPDSIAVSFHFLWTVGLPRRMSARSWCRHCSRVKLVFPDRLKVFRFFIISSEYKLQAISVMVSLSSSERIYSIGS